MKKLAFWLIEQYLEVTLKGLFEDLKKGALFGSIKTSSSSGKDWLDKKFTDKYCGGSADEYENLLSRFSRINSRSSKLEANAIIAVYIENET